VVANHLLRPAPLTRARVYARSHEGPRRSPCLATVPAEVARHPGAPGPLRGVALAACVGSARFALAARSCYPVRGARVQSRTGCGGSLRGFPAECRVAPFVELVEVAVRKFAVKEIAVRLVAPARATDRSMW
jgi:hypothetical protein